uniref:Uncharacterized protein n=1 Tax=Picea glauca TaxID=3330 RepID=A0A101LW72_PICGL|nr:hypothetical protein ABT39_MTgene1582 [Picea glauca]QHR88362.1 hypothetical protein Q903MT_gene2375 [Picea sitchensis]
MLPNLSKHRFYVSKMPKDVSRINWNHPTFRDARLPTGFIGSNHLICVKLAIWLNSNASSKPLWSIPPKS